MLIAQMFFIPRNMKMNEVGKVRVQDNEEKKKKYIRS
jgi:hypothetical protein